jgi:hypothetical protein
MDLKSLVKVRENLSSGVWIPWDEKGEISFNVTYCGKDAISKSRKASLSKKLNQRTHQYEETLDDDKFDYAIMKNTIIGWKGLKVKHLKEILDPRVDMSELAGQDEVEVEFNADNLDFIIKNYNLTFSRFISGASLDIEVYNKHQEEEQIKN